MSDAIRAALEAAALQATPPFTRYALLLAALCLRGTTNGWDDLPFTQRERHKRAAALTICGFLRGLQAHADPERRRAIETMIDAVQAAAVERAAGGGE